MSQKILTTVITARSGGPVKVYDQLLTNLFPIVNLSDLSCEYRRWKVIGLPPDKRELEKNRIALRFKVSSDVEGPAEIIRDGDDLILTIPEGYKDPKSTYSLIPHVASLKPLDGSRRVSFTSTDTSNRMLAERLLQSALNDNLRRYRELWQPKAGRPFYFKRPANAEDLSRRVDAFEGFSFRVVYVAEVGYCVLIDCSTRYISTEHWPEIIPYEDRWKYLRHNPASEEKGVRKFTHCLYRFCHEWYEVFVKAVLKESIVETLFTHPRTNQPISIYDYAVEKWGNISPERCAAINKEATPVTYVSWKGGAAKHAIASYCFPVVRTMDLERMGLGSLHEQYSIKQPEIRLKAITRFMNQWMKGAKLGPTPVEIAGEPLNIQRKIFDIPALEFGGGKVLDIASTPERLRHYPKERLKILQDPEGGFWLSDPLAEQWALVPRAAQDAIWPAFKRDLAKEISRFCGPDYKYEPKAIWYDDFGEGLSNQVKSIMEAFKKRENLSGRPSGYCLATLPSSADQDLPAYLTSTLSQANPPLHVACIHIDTFARFYTPGSNGGPWLLNQRHPQIGRAKGYLRNVAVKLLLINNRWPFVLKGRDPSVLNTLFVGVDVLNQVAGFTFIGNGGRICFFAATDIVEAESIPASKIRKMISQHIDLLPKAYNWSPQSVVLVRDGKLYEEEIAGFKSAMADTKTRSACAIEIPKRSALGVRFFNKTENKPGRIRTRNPRLGSWFEVHGNEIVISTTGWPFDIPGTSMPLTIRKRWGAWDIVQLGRYMFDLAQLAWTAPDRPARNPIVTRYTDLRLEAIAASFDEEETEFGSIESLEGEDE